MKGARAREDESAVSLIFQTKRLLISIAYNLTFDWGMLAAALALFGLWTVTSYFIRSSVLAYTARSPPKHQPQQLHVPIGS
jgi:hypothetical protein